MMKKILSIFANKKSKGLEKYKGFSDFFLNASDEEKTKVIREAARKSNEDQMKVFHEARNKVGVN